MNRGPFKYLAIGTSEITFYILHTISDKRTLKSNRFQNLLKYFEPKPKHLSSPTNLKTKLGLVVFLVRRCIEDLPALTVPSKIKKVPVLTVNATVSERNSVLKKYSRADPAEVGFSRTVVSAKIIENVTKHATLGISKYRKSHLHWSAAGAKKLSKKMHFK